MSAGSNLSIELPPTITPYIIFGLLALVGVTVGVEELRLHNWRADYATLQTANKQCEKDLTTANVNVTNLESSVKDQNARIKNHAAAAAVKEAQAKADALAALKAGEDAKAKAAKLDNGPDGMNSWIRSLYERP